MILAYISGKMLIKVWTIRDVKGCSLHLEKVFPMEINIIQKNEGLKNGKYFGKYILSLCII